MTTEENQSRSVLQKLSYSRSIRYFGWGFGEVLIPVFIFSFVQNYTETSLLSVVYYVSAVVFLPFIGQFADKLGAKKLLLVGLLLYPLIGASYVAAGMTHIALFIILARVVNGIARSSYKIGERITLRKYAASERISTEFGRLESVGDLIRSLGVVIGGIIIYVTNLPLYYLFIPIIPTALIALFPIRSLPDDLGEPTAKEKHILSRKNYLDVWKTFSQSSKQLKIYGSFYLIKSAIDAMFGLMIPILIYVDTSDIFLTILSGIVLNIPNLFSFYLGKIADKRGVKAFGTSFLLLSVLFLLFLIVPLYAGKLVVIFAIQIILVFIDLLIDGLSNKYIPEHQYGKAESVFQTLSSIGEVIGPIIGGIILDRAGQTNFFLILGIICVSVYLLYKKHSLILRQ